MSAIVKAAGHYLAATFPDAASFKRSPDYKRVRALFKSTYLAHGGKESNIKSYWARVMYREAFPGQGKVNGIFYMRLPGGSVVQDKQRNMKVPQGEMEVDMEEDLMDLC